MDFSDHDLGNHNHNHHHHHDYDVDGRFGEDVGPVLSPKAHRDVRTRDGRPASDSSLASSAATAAESPRVLGCRTTVLLLVFHGGSVLDSSHDASAKASDVATFQVKTYPRGLMCRNS